MSSAKTDFNRYLEQASQEIERELTRLAKKWNRYISKNFSELNDVNKRFTESLYGGKMIRGTLVKFGYELFQTSPVDEILKPAVAFELIHTSLLTHDDILDQSPTRRGKPALHVSKDSHYGLSQAICLGDLGIVLAYKLLAESKFPEEDKNKILAFFSHIISETIIGQMLDVEYSQRVTRTDKQIMNLYHMKTAHYTIVGPLTVGAILAGATDEMIDTLRKFGEQLGIAFQIQDDILGVFGENTTTGKSTTSDIEENKSTLLFSDALKHANPQQKQLLKLNYGKKNITKSQHDQIKKVFIDTGALKYCQTLIKRLVNDAKGMVEEITKNKEKQQQLLQLADMLVQRKK